MKTPKKASSKYNTYSDFYDKVVKEIKDANGKSEREAKKALLDKLEGTMKGKDLVIEGNFSC